MGPNFFMDKSIRVIQDQDQGYQPSTSLYTVQTWLPTWNTRDMTSMTRHMKELNKKGNTHTAMRKIRAGNIKSKIQQNTATTNTPLLWLHLHVAMEQEGGM